MVKNPADVLYGWSYILSKVLCLIYDAWPKSACSRFLPTPAWSALYRSTTVLLYFCRIFSTLTRTTNAIIHWLRRLYADDESYKSYSFRQMGLQTHCRRRSYLIERRDLRRLRAVVIMCGSEGRDLILCRRCLRRTRSLNVGNTST